MCAATLDDYEKLGLKPGASKEEIKKRYKELVQLYHPDKHINNPLSSLAQEKFKEINEAYQNLMNEDESYQYNSSYTSSNRGRSTQPNNLDGYVHEIIYHLENRMWGKSIEIADQALKHYSNEPVLYSLKAYAYKEMSQYDTAINLYKMAEAMNWAPQINDLWNYALCYMETGRFYEAIPIIERVIKIGGDIPNCIAHLAWCYESVGNMAKANENWAKVERIDPNNQMLQQRKQAIRIGNQYVNKRDAASSACWLCILLECLCDCC